MMKKTILFALVLSFFFVSCQDDEKNEPTENTELKTISNTFKSIKEINDNLGVDGKTGQELLELYNKNVKNQVAQSVQDQFANWLEHLKDNADQEAEKGKAGKMGKKSRLLNAKGVEVGQFIEQGFIGAFQLNGFTNALKVAAMSADTKEARKKELDKAVTYLLGDIAYLNKEKVDGQYPEYEDNQFVHYMNKVSEKEGIYKGVADSIYATIKTAYTQTDNQNVFVGLMMKLNGYVTQTVGFRTVEKLKKYSKELEEEGKLKSKIAHELSEGLGFAYSLQFAYKGRGQFYITSAQAQEFVDIDLWDTQAPEILNQKATEIEEMFSFALEK